MVSLLCVFIEIELLPGLKDIIDRFIIPSPLVQVILDGIINNESLISIGVFLTNIFLSKVCPIPSREMPSANNRRITIFNFG